MGLYRSNVRFGRFSAGEEVEITDERLPDYESAIDEGWLTEIRTPQGMLAEQIDASPGTIDGFYVPSAPRGGLGETPPEPE